MSETQVELTGVGVGKRLFGMEHAQKILDIRTAPRVWSLTDKLYEMKDGKISLKEIDSTKKIV